MNQLIFAIGGKERGFKLGLGFLGDILKHYDTDLMGLGKLMVKNPYDLTPTILYYAHIQYCARNSQVVDFNLYDVQDWVEGLDDPMNDKNIEAVLKLLIDTIKKYLPKKEETEEDNDTEKKS